MKKTVKVIKNLPNYAKGNVYELDVKEANALLELGYAVEGVPSVPLENEFIMPVQFEFPTDLDKDRDPAVDEATPKKKK